MSIEKPRLRLIGEDGNAFAILGRACRAARGAGWTKEEIEAFMKSATSGDYTNLLSEVMKRFEVFGKEEEEEEDGIEDPRD